MNGIIAERKNYKEDDLNGLYQKYQWPHEYLLEEGNYKNGEKIGEWKNNPSLFFFSEWNTLTLKCINMVYFQ